MGQFCWRSGGGAAASCLVTLLLLFVVLGNDEMSTWFCANGWAVRLKNRSDADATKVNGVGIVSVANFLIDAARLFTLDDDDDAPVAAPVKSTKRGRGPADGDGNEVHKRGH